MYSGIKIKPTLDKYRMRQLIEGLEAVLGDAKFAANFGANQEGAYYQAGIIKELEKMLDCAKHLCEPADEFQQSVFADEFFEKGRNA